MWHCQHIHNDERNKKHVHVLTVVHAIARLEEVAGRSRQEV